MPRGPKGERRPADVIGNTVHVMRIATGQITAHSTTRLSSPAHRAPRRSLLCRSSVQGHRSEIMFGVLVVVLGRDQIAALGFSLGQRQIPLIVSLRVMRALRLWAGSTGWPPF